MINHKDFFVCERRNTIARFLNIDVRQLANHLSNCINDQDFRDQLYDFLCQETLKENENFNCKNFLAQFYSLCYEISITNAYEKSLSTVINQIQKTETDSNLTNSHISDLNQSERPNFSISRTTSGYFLINDKFLYCLAKKLSKDSAFELSLEVTGQADFWDDLEREYRNDELTLKRKSLQFLRNYLYDQTNRMLTPIEREKIVITELMQNLRTINRNDLSQFIQNDLQIRPSEISNTLDIL